ncbi:MAG TPA: argininosuccinate lyase [Rhodospirillales bacterium]|nr:argininosuccinate lyase [Rhodospirillales bacterium]
MNRQDGSSSSTIWGGRFEAGPSSLMEAINASIDFDKRLYAQDIASSKAHAQMLVAQGILSENDGKDIQRGLDAIAREIEEGDFEFSVALEDIHMNIENRLSQLVGEAAGRLHTARSRNDQVATDFKLWVRDAIDGINASLAGLQGVMIDIAGKNAATVMPGFTHLQTAQPVTLGHHMLAYVEMFGRDRGRFGDCRTRLNECPLGAAALAGTSFPIDRRMTSDALGFDRPAANSLDAVSDRDFACEFLSAGSILAVHLSRLAEEIVLWSAPQFGYVRISDSFSSGSSIMPQKRNPDAAELVRGKAGRVIGSLNAMLVALKGLPLAYGKDMQEDKEPVFDAADTLGICIAAMKGMLGEAKFDESRMKADAGKGFTTATDLADWLVRAGGIPFRQAHHITGTLVKMAEDKNCDLEDLSLKDMQSVETAITDEVFAVLGVENSVSSRTSEGGTAPANVTAAAAKARKRFLE